MAHSAAVSLKYSTTVHFAPDLSQPSPLERTNLTWQICKVRFFQGFASNFALERRRPSIHNSCKT
ncbi:hypothetical protein TM5383_02245 [Thalassovita mediterranea]|uniref:Uncharacterized protein n=1 Tax=Thalassovita mediterranea TaxID=340021 RepID=A0A0P1H4P5_9RHOB|nr:hypothetical protein TM5383_02245 [Thalassovita mediterranea]SIS35381.1 hypothetical protein SAMN05421685_11536 [Thalassovita mediterranea]